MAAFLFTVTCLQCGGPLRACGPAKVHEVEAVIRVVCEDCRTGASLRVLYSNARLASMSTTLPAVMR